MSSARECARHLAGGLELPRGRGVPGHAPALVAIDHQVDGGAHGIAHGGEAGQVPAPVVGGAAQLDGAEAASDELLREVAARGLVAPERRRGISPHAVLRAPEQAKHRLALDLAAQVPERDVERPPAPVVEAEIVEHGVVTLDVEGVVAAKEEVGVLGEAPHGVARCHALQPLIGADAHQADGKARARPAVPRDRHGRVERDAVTGDLDRGDFHGCRA